jgi:hypothetical protein
MSSDKGAPATVADEKLLATLGYKQEFQRAFTPLEVRALQTYFHGP